MTATLRNKLVMLAAIVLLLTSVGHAAAQGVVVSRYYTPPVTYYSAPTVSYYAPTVSYYPTTAYYSTPTVSYYSAPATVSYYSAPTVSYYAPAVGTYTAPVATTRYGLFGRPRTTTYYPAYYVYP